MLPLPLWLRRTLFSTGVMNIVVACVFLPGATWLRAAAGLPETAPSIYLLTVALFILLFGCGYLWTALHGCAERLFIALGAGGKLAFFTLVLVHWMLGELPLRAATLASADLIFGGLLLLWLLTGTGAQEPPRRDAAARRA